MSKKAIYLFDLDIGSRIHKVLKSKHAFERRGNATHVRDEFLNPERYKTIIEHAFMHGLSSFRNKGAVAISFMDYKETTYSVLTKISDDAVFIITVYTGRGKGPLTYFIKERNRVNLWNHYTLPRMSNAERKAKDLAIIQHENERNFSLSMRGISIPKWKRGDV